MRKGFTLIELILVLGILATLFGIASVRFLGVQNKSQLAEGGDILIADLRSQQMKAMTGLETTAGTVPSGYGVYFESDRYTLFAGDTYSAADTRNAVVLLPAGVTLTTAFAGDTIVFLRASGEVKDYADGQDTIDLTSGGVATTTHIRINRFGVVAEGI